MSDVPIGAPAKGCVSITCLKCSNIPNIYSFFRLGQNPYDHEDFEDCATRKSFDILFKMLFTVGLQVSLYNHNILQIRKKYIYNLINYNY